MKVLDAHSWMQQNQDRFPNGSIVSEIMTAYAKYYHTVMVEKTLKRKKPNDN